MTAIDARSAVTLSTLLNGVQARFRAFHAAANAYLNPNGLELRFVSGTRSYDEQGALYAKGRTVKSDVPCKHGGVSRKVGKCPVHPLGATVTNARAGYSWHNWGLAVDVGLFKKGVYLTESQFYSKLCLIGDKVGLEWGGRWKTPDQPHYQIRPDFLKGLPDSKCFPLLIGMMKEGKNALGETALS